MKMGEKIDLGIKEKPLESVTMPATASEAKADETVKTRYPHMHYEGEEELEIPKKGTACIEYEITWSQEEEREDGTERYSCRLDIKSIQPCGESAEEEEEEEEEPEPPAKSGSPAADALDKLMEAYLEKQKGD